MGWGAEAVFVAGLVGHGAHMFLQPFLSACCILLYYDLRIRKEGFNLEMMAKSLGTPLPTQPSA